MAREAHAPIHSGEVLQEEFLGLLEITQYRLAKDISVPRRIPRGAAPEGAQTDGFLGSLATPPG